MMKLIVGLGNKGDRYVRTRHNVGFMLANQLVDKLDLNWEEDKKFNTLRAEEKVKEGEVVFCKPQTMMNSSGKTVSSIANYYKIKPNDIYIIHDDLDIKLGEKKIQKGKGPREHKGLLSIYKELGTKDFWHVRIGVDNREPGNRISGEDYVLMDFSEEELEVLEEVKQEVIDEVVNLIS